MGKLVDSKARQGGKDTTLGTRLKPNVVPDWNIPNGNNSRRNNLVGNTTGTSVAGQIT